MSSSLFAPGELEAIHAQISQLREETARINAEAGVHDANKLACVHVWQTLSLALGLVSIAGGITALIMRYLI